MFKFLLLVLIAVPGMVFGETLEERVSGLETRVDKLEKWGLNPCFDKADGFTLSGSTRALNKKEGKWTYVGGAHVENFEFKVIRKEQTPQGFAIVIVRVYAPRYQPVCESMVFAENDVVLY